MENPEKSNPGGRGKGMTNSSSSMQMSCLFTQMTTYLEELVRPQPPEDVGLGGMTEKVTEEEVLGYRMAGPGRGKGRSESSG